MSSPEVSRGSESRRDSNSRAVWQVGPSRSSERLLVLLACGRAEADPLLEAWSGQAIDVLYCADLAVALARAGQSRPDMVVVGGAAGVLGPVAFLVALRQVDPDTPVIVGLDHGLAHVGAEVLGAGATAR